MESAEDVLNESVHSAAANIRIAAISDAEGIDIGTGTGRGTKAFEKSLKRDKPFRIPFFETTQN